MVLKGKALVTAKNVQMIQDIYITLRVHLLMGMRRHKIKGRKKIHRWYHFWQAYPVNGVLRIPSYSERCIVREPERAQGLARGHTVRPLLGLYSSSTSYGTISVTTMLPQHPKRIKTSLWKTKREKEIDWQKGPVSVAGLLSFTFLWLCALLRWRFVDSD